MSETINIDQPPVAPSQITLHFGEHKRLANHADQSLLTTIGCSNPACTAPHFAAYRLSARVTGKWRTLYVSFSANQLRERAAHFLAVADELDGGKGKQ